MKQQVFLSKLVNSHLVWALILLLSLLLFAGIPLGEPSLFQAGNAPQTCGEHCIDVGSLDWLTTWSVLAGSSPTGNCGEHCIDVGAIEGSPNQKLNHHNL